MCRHAKTREEDAAFGMSRRNQEQPEFLKIAYCPDAVIQDTETDTEVSRFFI